MMSAEPDFVEGRGKRNRRTVDYSKFAADVGDDTSDDDFLGFTPPAPQVKIEKPKSKKTAKKKTVVESDMKVDEKAPPSRPSLDAKLLERDLKKAMDLSLSNSSSPLDSVIDIHPIVNQAVVVNGDDTTVEVLRPPKVNQIEVASGDKTMEVLGPPKVNQAVVIDGDIIEVLGSEMIVEPVVPLKRKRKTLPDFDDDDDEFRIDDDDDDKDYDGDFNSKSKRSKLNKKKSSTTTSRKKPSSTTTAKTTKPKQATKTKPKNKTPPKPKESCVKEEDEEDSDLKLALQLSMADCEKSTDVIEQQNVLEPIVLLEKPPVPVEGVVIINSIHKSPSPVESPVKKRCGRRVAAAATIPADELLLDDDDVKENIVESISDDDDFNLSDESADDVDDDDSDFDADEGRSKTKKKTPSRTTSKKPAANTKQKKADTRQKSSRPAAAVTPSIPSRVRPGLANRTPVSSSVATVKSPVTGGKVAHMGLSKSGTPRSSLGGGLSIRSPGLRLGLSRSQKNFKSLHPSLIKR